MSDLGFDGGRVFLKIIHPDTRYKERVLLWPGVSRDGLPWRLACR